MDLNAVRDFLAVAEHGSYAEAGRLLGLPKSTLSRRVAALEQSLGVRLIDRNSRRLRLTAEGDELRERAGTLVAALSDLEEQVRPGDAPLKGSLRISVPVLFGHVCLGRIAARFAEAHPGVLLEAVVEDRTVDLLREGFDAALRVNPSTDSTLTGRLLGRNRLVLVASPALASRLGYEGRSPQDLVWPAVVRQGWGDDGGWNLAGAEGVVRILAQARLDLSSPLAIRDAVVAGAGAALLPQILVGEDLAVGRLIRLGERIGAPEEIWIVHASGRLPSRRLRALMDTMVAFFADEPLSGR
ncbi:MAG: LysR family transcriptional regulator [Acetobacteraceae bacterium]|nr:LysR family transcriptional regulator [Acetobacteraceae bacterium]MBV8576058.1 LysR family transcriptional regulator [Acetobacteraceae bacterium]